MGNMIPPLNIRGARGVIKLSKFPPQDKRGFGGITNKWLATFITPFVPLTLRGIYWKEMPLTLRGNKQGRVQDPPLG
jgi:hypothetical protein